MCIRDSTRRFDLIRWGDYYKLMQEQVDKAQADESWKFGINVYTCLLYTSGNDKQPQLYDLSSDPSEKTNVSKQHPDIVKELSELLESIKEK